MATPSSSATSPSPPMAMAFISHGPTPMQSTPSPSAEHDDRDTKKKSVARLVARAELSNVTRSLRNRLSYASHKTPALSRYALARDMELNAQPAPPFGRSTAAARRKTPAAIGFAAPASPMRRGPAGTSAPGPSRSTYGNGAGDPGGNARYSFGGQTLFTSILAPPPPQQARTILNAGDPPLPAPMRPEPHAAGVVRSIAEGTRAHAKSAHPDPSPARRKGKAPKSRSSRPHDDQDQDGDVDMKAAKTLTSLLLQHRPSPRSSFDASSDHHYPRSFPQPPQQSSFRDRTPPENAPRPAPTDNEAADLMLFLATSPSPARPNKDNSNARDQAAFRALGGANNGMRAKGRVLFPTAGESSSNYRGTPAALSRPGEASFTSSISSIGSDLGRRDPYPPPPPQPAPSTSSNPLPPRPIQNRSNTPSQLLPPPTLPSHSSVPSSPSGLRKSHDASPRPTHEFNIHEFIHASPSPSRGQPPPQQQQQKGGLRADVGRKLFEGEQQSRAGGGGVGGMNVNVNMGSPSGGHLNNNKRPDDRLGAGIDLVKS